MVRSGIIAKYLVDMYDLRRGKARACDLEKFIKWVIDEYEIDITDIYNADKRYIRENFETDDYTQDLESLEEEEYISNVIRPQISDLNRR